MNVLETCLSKEQHVTVCTEDASPAVNEKDDGTGYVSTTAKVRATPVAKMPQRGNREGTLA